MSYSILRPDNSVVQGPFSRSKCKRLLSGMTDTDKADLRIVKNPTDPNAPPKPPREKKAKKIRESVITDSPGPELEVDPDVNKYVHRSGTFSSKEAVEAVMKRLEIKEFVVKFDKGTGYYALYND